MKVLKYFENVLRKENEILDLTILNLFVNYFQNEAFFLLLFYYLSSLKLFQQIKRKHEELVFDTVRSLEEVKRKWFKTSLDTICIETCENESLLLISNKI